MRNKNQIVILLSLVFIFITFNVYINKKEIRYIEYPRHFNAIFNEEGTIDYAFFGNSQGFMAITAPIVESQLKSKANLNDIVVQDFGRSWRSQEHMYLLVRDLLENRSVKNLFLELNMWPGPGRHYHPNFQFNAGPIDQIEALFKNRKKKAFEKMSLFLKWQFNKIVKRFEQFLTGKYPRLEIKSKKIKAVSKDVSNHVLDVTPVTLESKRKKFSNTWKKNVTGWDVSSKYESVNTHYTKKIIALAKEKNVKIYGFYVPRYFSSPLNPIYKTKMEKEFSIKLFVPPMDIHEKLNRPRMFRDYSHMMDEGSRVYTNWLTSVYLEFKK